MFAHSAGARPSTPALVLDPISTTVLFASDAALPILFPAAARVVRLLFLASRFLL